MNYYVHSFVGVTTNSEAGVSGDFLAAYAPVFAAMQEHDMVLNLHGEMPGDLPTDTMSLEEAFLPELKKLHDQFPRLRCILEVSGDFCR
jgi:dihydroorotase